MARKRKGSLEFQQKLILNKWLLNLFGKDNLEDLSADLKEERFEGYDAENISLFYHRITNPPLENTCIRPEELLVFDENIFRHTERLNRYRTEKIRWKYFQYFALLFTEIYLDRYFHDSAGLREELNKYVKAFNTQNEPADHVDPFDQNDLSRITFFQATGSGKTLLMHINVMQYQHYLKKSNTLHELNHIILLTPNEGLSKQHLGEFKASGIPAVLFEKEKNRNLFSGRQVEIIDIHKLADKMGDKTVAVEAFEGKNLVLVDEGHRGSSGEEWMKRRNRLSEGGFTFEYSATFEQAVAASNDKKLEQQYAKSILFNYSYRYFYYDGFGKDFKILNLDDSKDVNGPDRALYLTACTLTFYQQMRFFEDNQQIVHEFNLEKPLLVLVGSRVTKSLSKKEASDVIEFLLFLGNFLKNERASIRDIKTILRDQHGLSWENRNIFSDAFTYLDSLDQKPAEIFTDIKRHIFNSDHGFLIIEHLKGSEGEIALRLGDAHPFGIINVGDSKKLAELCRKYEDVFEVRDREFADSYFTRINEKDSSINILIGSKKFSEGWNSWRVSTMGLMNVGKKEGSEIIQLFGRGVRLKGFNFCLKRSSEVSNKPPKHIKKLETLNVFGVRSGYMKQFSEFLEKEGLYKENDFRDIILPVLCHPTFNNQKKLKTIQLKEGLDYKKDAPHPVLELELEYFRRHPVVINWYPKIQARISPDADSFVAMANPERDNFLKDHLSFMDINKLFFDLESYKNQHGWHTLNLSKKNIRELLLDPSWYEIEIPRERMKFSSNMADDILRWEEIASALLKKYLERFYKLKRSRWEQKHLEYRFLDEQDRNLLWNEENEQHQYVVSVNVEREDLIEEIMKLKKSIENGNPRSLKSGDFNILFESKHLYQPLIYVGKEVSYIKVKPVALNEGERIFVEGLESYVKKQIDFFKDKEVYLLRNQSRGTGVGFFDEGAFYPDFILWILWDGFQYISFVDPHGMRHARLEDPKLKFYERIKEIEDSLRQHDDRITLNSFIVSTTAHKTGSPWWGSDLDIKEFHNSNIFFQKEDSDLYIKEIVDRSLRRQLDGNSNIGVECEV